jgi:acetyl esterase
MISSSPDAHRPAPLAEDVRVYLEHLAEEGLASPPVRTPEEFRAAQRLMGRLMGPGPEVAAVEAHLIEAGGRAIPIQIYTPRHDCSGGVILYLHGGGWVSGERNLYDAYLRSLALATDCRVLYLEYRLAPEHRFPAALDDASEGLEWAATWAGRLAPGAKLIVCGDSAGGNLAAAAVRRARDAGSTAVDLQVLICPVLDHDFETSSYRAFGDGFMLTAASMRAYWDHYVPAAADRHRPDASPLREADLRRLPPTLIVAADHDPLHDEAAAYARRLEDAGVPVTYWDWPGVIHGWYMMVDVLGESQHSALERIARFITQFVSSGGGGGR